MRELLSFVFGATLVVAPFSACAAIEPSAEAAQTTLLSDASQTKADEKTDSEVATAAGTLTHDELEKFCEQQLALIPQASGFKKIPDACMKAKQMPTCSSVKHVPIPHFDFPGTLDKNGPHKPQNILVFGLIHGDEEQSASVTLSWLHRLIEIQPRNNWRIIPVLNPDGWKLKTRTNANGIDVNRNFPSGDWQELAVKYWKTKQSANPRRFPGLQPASEPETRCAMDQIAEFHPDFVISIHTPLGVLDFDGPRVEMPKFSPLPWVSLGNFPGSLGRYMWVDRKVPVLTVELKAQKLAARSLEQFDKLQDITGTVAIQAEKAIKKNAKN